MGILGTVAQGLGVGTAIGGLLGSLGSSTPSYDYSGYDKALNLLNNQQASLTDYYNQAGTQLESQYKSYYGQSMQDAVNSLAARGIYDSPISQVSLNRTTQKLADVYANSQSTLQGQKLSAQSALDQQIAQYQISLNNAKYQEQLNQYQSDQSKYGAIGGAIGAATSLF